MIVKTRISSRCGRLFAVVALAALVSGCGTDETKTAGTRAAVGAAKSVFGLFTGLIGADGKKEAVAPNLPLLVQKALAATPGPVMIAVVERYNATVVVAPNVTNGEYVTWKTPDLRTFSFKHDVLTSTRGFGDDLMSSEADGAIAQIRSGQAGTATRTYYFLGGQGQTTALRMRCSYATGDNVRLAIGNIDAMTTPVVETCQRGADKVENLYWVDKAGHVLKSRQWISAAMGHLVIQHLRI